MMLQGILAHLSESCSFVLFANALIFSTMYIGRFRHFRFPKNCVSMFSSIRVMGYGFRLYSYTTAQARNISSAAHLLQTVFGCLLAICSRCFIKKICRQLHAMFAWLISRTFSVNKQYFSLTTNQPTVLSAMAAKRTVELGNRSFWCKKTSVLDNSEPIDAGKYQKLTRSVFSVSVRCFVCTGYNRTSIAAH